MASPNVTGSLALLQQHYQNTHSGKKMTAATLKALVIHTADEAGLITGPDYMYGWGLLNTAKAAEVISEDGGDDSIIDGILTDGNKYTVQIDVPELTPLLATICWTDPPGTPEPPSLNPATKMLVNDLDLRIATNGTTWRPWILDPQEPHLPATTGDNITDNVEQVYIENAAPGNYTLTISHKNNLRSGQQAFSLIISSKFATPIKPKSNIKWEEKFTATRPPLGWQVVDNDGDNNNAGWTFFQVVSFTDSDIDVNPQAGISFWFANFEGANSSGLIDEWLVSPRINEIETGDSLYLWAGAVGGSYDDSLKVFISTTGNEIADFADQIGYFKVDGPIGSWHRYGFDLSPFDGEDIHFAVNYYIRDGGQYGAYSDNVWLDHFIITTDTTNVPPVVSNPLADLSLPEDFEPRVIADLQNVFYDKDQTPLVFTASTDSNTLASIIEQNLMLSSVENFFGRSTVIVAANDGKALVSDTFYVDILSLNDPAQLVCSFPDTMISEDCGPTTIIPDLNSYFFDADCTALQFSSEADTNLAVIIEADSVVATPRQDFYGEVSVTISATDGEHTATDTFIVTVKPVNDTPILADLPDISFPEDSSYPLPLNPFVSDVDNDSTEITFSTNVLTAQTFKRTDAAMITIQDLTVTIDSLSHVATFNSNSDSSGAFSVLFTARDDSGAATGDTISVIVTPVNDPPIITESLPDMSIREDSGKRLLIEHLHHYFQDAETYPLMFSAIADSGIDLKVVGDSLFIAPDTNYFGFNQGVISASDSYYTVSDSFAVIVNSVNDPPRWSALPDVEFPEDSSRTLALNPFVSDVDNDSSQIKFFAAVLSATGRKNADAAQLTIADLSVVIDSLTHIVTFGSTVDSSGRFDVLFIAQDDSGATAFDTMSVKINPVNDLPQLARPLPDTTLIEDSAENLLLWKLSDFFTDADRTQLTFTAKCDSGIDVHIRSDSLFVSLWPDFYGRCELIIRASDAVAAVYDTLTVTVVNVNDSPLVFALMSPVDGDTIYSIMEPVSFEWQAALDIDSDILTYQLNIYNSQQDTVFNADSDVTFLFDGSTFWRPGQVYRWTALAYDGLAVTASSDTFSVVIKKYVNVAMNTETVPRDYTLAQNYPTPFTPMTHIRFGLPKKTRVTLEVVNIYGQKIITLIDDNRNAGFHTIPFDANHLASGIYFYKIEADDFVQVRKMILMK